jgi:alpha/beta superfamily hydrolase
VTRASEIVTADGVRLEAELATPDGVVRAGAVLCHPHPLYGGTMRSIVIGAMFDALPRRGVSCLRFNFRGVGRSGGVHDEGRAEQLDARAAVAALAAALPTPAPLVLVGWSFGADVALSVRDERIDAWLAIAPPLRFAADLDALAADPRPKLLALAQHDEFRDPASVVDHTEGWTATEVEVVGGASHFFVGRTDRLVEIAAAYVDRVVASTPSR